MFVQTHYLLRSKADGRHLSAQIPLKDPDAPAAQYILLFKNDYDALSYLNAHAADVSHQFAVEAIAQPQLKGLLQRWGFQGVGLVDDPLIPNIQFLTSQARL